jgi:hypothetical protein
LADAHGQTLTPARATVPDARGLTQPSGFLGPGGFLAKYRSMPLNIAWAIACW